MPKAPESTPAVSTFVKAPPRLEGEGVPIGEFNHDEIAYGKRGFGKSWKLLERMEELNNEAGGAYKIGHSPEMRFPAEATSIQIRYHEKISSLDSWLRREPDDFHVWVSEEADPIIEYAKDLGKALKKRAMGFWNTRGTPLGKKATPVILVVDELAFLSGAKGSAQGSGKNDWFRRFLISLRHNHVAFLGGIQDANAISYILGSLADTLWCYRTTHEWALQSLRAAGLPQEKVERLKTLEIGEYIKVEL
jgi:hypothetical protein